MFSTFCPLYHYGEFIISICLPTIILYCFVRLRIPELGTLVSPKFPDTMLFDGSDQFYGAEGFRYEPVVPMKHWKLSYEGILK
jgi:hypothetical protein